MLGPERGLRLVPPRADRLCGLRLGRELGWVLGVFVGVAKHGRARAHRVVLRGEFVGVHREVFEGDEKKIEMFVSERVREREWGGGKKAIEMLSKKEKENVQSFLLR